MANLALGEEPAIVVQANARVRRATVEMRVRGLSARTTVLAREPVISLPGFAPAMVGSVEMIALAGCAHEATTRSRMKLKTKGMELLCNKPKSKRLLFLQAWELAVPLLLRTQIFTDSHGQHAPFPLGKEAIMSLITRMVAVLLALNF